MAHENNQNHSLNQTMRARGQLYVLLTQFRKEATESNDPEVSSIFYTAAEVIAGLARSFREYEEQSKEGGSENEESSSDCTPSSPL